MKIRSIILFILIGLTAQNIQSQNSTDAYRFSSYDLLGSARFVALGGAYSSVGGDLSALNYNPAGLGIFQSSEFSFSPSLNYVSNTSIYNGSTGIDSKTNLNSGMFGMVNTRRFNEKSRAAQQGWKAINYGFSINRIKNFNNQLFMGGKSFSSSMASVWQDEANGYYPENLGAFSSGLAWDTYVLDSIPGNPTQYYSNAPIAGVMQNYWESSKGYINEMSFAISANYNDKLILGLSIGIPNLHYERKIDYTEEALGDVANYEYTYMHYQENLLTKGSGINAKLGIIYIVSPSIRISAAYHTPTYYGQLTDEYSTRIESSFNDGSQYSSDSPIGNMVYDLSTPSRLMTGLSFFLNKRGFISLDYERMDFGASKLSSSTYAFTNENTDIRNDYQITNTIRLGAEWRFDFITLRGGYNLYSSPTNTQVNNIISSAYSWGLGYRVGHTYLDFAYSKRTTDNSFYMYNPDYVNPASLSNTKSNYILTLGYKF